LSTSGAAQFKPKYADRGMLRSTMEHFLTIGKESIESVAVRVQRDIAATVPKYDLEITNTDI
jgi:hypothetical protein